MTEKSGRPFNIPLGSSGENLALKTSNLIDNHFFYKGERQANTGSLFSRGFRVQGDDKQVYEVKYRPSLLDNLPTVHINGSRVTYAPPLPWWMYLIAVAMLVPVFVTPWALWSTYRTYSPDALQTALICGPPFPIMIWLFMFRITSAVVRKAHGKPGLRLAFALLLLLTHFAVSAAANFCLLFSAAV